MKMQNIQIANIAGKSNNIEGTEFQIRKGKFQSW